MFIRKIQIVLLLIITLSAFRTFAYEMKTQNEDISSMRNITTERDVFCDDYTDSVIGSLPPGYSLFNEQNGYVQIAEYDVTLDDGRVVRKNCLELDDKYSDTLGQYMWAGPGFYRTFKATGPRIAVELHFMFVKKTTPYFANEIYTMSDNTNITRWVATASTGVPTWWSQVGFTEELPSFVSGVWFTHRIIVDLENNMAQIRVTSPQLGIDKTYTELGFCTKESKKAESINKLFFDTQTGDGKMVFDYIKVESNPEDLPGADEFVHPAELIEPVYCETPSEHPKQKGVNLMVDGKYKYTSTPLFIDSNITMIYFKNFARLLDGEIKNNYSVFVNNTNIEFFADSSKIKINGIENNMNCSAVNVDGKLFIPLRFAADLAGYDVGWNAETRTVLLERR